MGRPAGCVRVPAWSCHSPRLSPSRQLPVRHEESSTSAAQAGGTGLGILISTYTWDIPPVTLSSHEHCRERSILGITCPELQK